MPTKWANFTKNKIWLLEGVVLTVSLPFLLFPTQFPLGTLVALLGLIFIEVGPLLLKWRAFQSPSPIDVPLLLFCMVLGVSFLVTADPDLTLDKASGALLGIFLWRYLNRFAKTANTWRMALAVFGVFGLGFVTLGVLNASWLNKLDVLTPLVDRLPNQVVAVPGQPSDGIHPNQIAGTLLFYFPLLWSVLFGAQWHKRSWFKWLWLSFTLLGTAVLILTQSRSGWLGGVAAIYILTGAWAISLPPSHRIRRLLFMLLGLLTLVGLAALAIIGPERLVSLWQDPAQETAVGSLSSLNFRQEVWRWTIVAIQDFPFTGIGLGSFRRTIRRLYPLGVEPSNVVAHAHNLYLHTAVDIGIPGLIIYLTLIGLVLTLAWKTSRNQARLRPYALGLAAGLFAYHIYGVGDMVALGAKTGLAFWFLLGLITTLHQLSHNPKESAKF